MASAVQICNLALQKLGAARINSLTEDGRNARECNAAYELMRDAELRAHPWNFARARAQLAEDSTAPDFGFDHQYTLPSDFLRLHPDSEVDDWQIEGRKILTDDDAPLEIIYIKRVTDTAQFDALFVVALANRLAMQLCEKITQSNTKKAEALRDYVLSIREARRVNAIENVATDPPDDPWITARE